MPGSSESGAVPNTSVIVPPDFPLVELVDVELEELEELTSTSRWPVGIPGIFDRSQRGFRTSMNDLPATTFSIRYGPTPGGGEARSLRSAVPRGIGASAGSASTSSNAPYAAVRTIVIRPLASSTWMPEMRLVRLAANAAAPLIRPMMKPVAPAQRSLIARSTAHSKSLALTAWPLE